MHSTSVISHKTTTKSVLDLINLYDHGHLNLEPGFQRQSVWYERDRAKLIDSILRNYPLPAIFLYKRQEWKRKGVGNQYWNRNGIGSFSGRASLQAAVRR